MTSEKGFQQAVVDVARLCGWRVYWTHNSRNSPAGWPDLVLIRPPECIFRELKRDSRPSRVTPDQRDTMDALTDCGLDVSVWTPDDWPLIEHTLQRRHQ